MLMLDYWKTISKEFYPNFSNYEASYTGMVRRVLTRKILKGGTNSRGYSVITLHNGKVRKNDTKHRVVGLTFFGYAQHFDHKDHNKLNNRCDNIRPVTASENQANRAITMLSMSRYKGVTYDKRCNKWSSLIVVNYQRIWLGYHKTQEDAAMAYNNAALRLRGEYALLNNV